MNAEPVAFNPSGHAIRPEPGYDYVREIASGGYGFVSLFTRTPPGPGPVEFVAGKFIYRDTFGPPDDAGSNAAYHRAVAGLQNFRSLSGRSDDLLHVFDVRQRHEEGYFCYMMELADDLETGRQIEPAR